MAPTTCRGPRVAGRRPTAGSRACVPGGTSIGAKPAPSACVSIEGRARRSVARPVHTCVLRTVAPMTHRVGTPCGNRGRVNARGTAMRPRPVVCSGGRRIGRLGGRPRRSVALAARTAREGSLGRLRGLACSIRPHGSITPCCVS